jgi:hypothetical protein
LRSGSKLSAILKTVWLFSLSSLFFFFFTSSTGKWIFPQHKFEFYASQTISF